MTDDYEEHAVFFSVYGVTRFDATAVAKAVREGRLTAGEAHGLANLLEGKHPQGLKLKMIGQGKNWTPIKEGAEKFALCKAIGMMMDACLSHGNTWEQATLDTADHFGVSESTISRNVALWRKIQDAEI